MGRRPDAVAEIRAAHRSVEWRGVRVGMTVAELTARVGGLGSPGWGHPHCPGFETTVESDGDTVDISVSGDRPTDVVTGLSAPLDDRLTKEQIVARLERAIPELSYFASRHDPELDEHANPTPMYCLDRGDEDVCVLVKPGEQIMIAFIGCFD